MNEADEKALRVKARKQIRARMRSLRKAHPEAALAVRSGRIAERLVELPEYAAAGSIALFWPLSQEVDLRPLDTRARADGKRVYYPVMDPRGESFSTGMAEAGDPSELRDRGRSFPEPAPESRRAGRGDIGLVVVPALAVSASGHRLGYGVGFYDATLPDFCPPAFSVVVAFDFQLLAELPEMEHDVACDLVVTDARTVRASAALLR